jgi:hypothetical protein
MGHPTADQRVHRRAGVELEVGLIGPDRTLSGLRARNISLGGVFLESADSVPLAPGTEVSLVFGPREPASGHRFSARVVHANGQGVGLIFCDFSLEDFARLQRILDGEV